VEPTFQSDKINPHLVGALCARARPSGRQGASTPNARKLPKAAIFLRSGSLRSILDAGHARSPKAPYIAQPRRSGEEAMGTLTINSIRSNPFNVLLQELPERPGRLLLELAYIAATYYRDSERLLMEAAADGRLRFYVRNPNNIRKAYDECEVCHDAACYKMDEISNIFENEFDEWICDIER